MAGSYPDVPGYRFAYDVDGTLVVIHPSTGGAVTLSSTVLASLNNDTFANAAAPGNAYLAFLFPEPRDITGIFYNKGVSLLVDDISISRDTTNGIDGSWENVTPMPQAYAGITQNSPRLGIRDLSLSNITSLRFNNRQVGGDNAFRIIHFYGGISPANSPDRLRIIDMSQTSTTSDSVTQTGEDIAAQFDFGNTPQRSSLTRQFRVVNNSTTQSAHNITISLQAPTNSTPSLIGQFQLSTDGIAFANAINIGSLNPGQNSTTMYLRVNVAAAMQLSVWSARIIAHAVSWS